MTGSTAYVAVVQATRSAYRSALQPMTQLSGAHAFRRFIRQF